MARKFYIEQNEAIPAIAFELSAPTGFIEITDSNVLCKLYMDQYKERTQQGVDYYNEFRTTKYLQILDATYTATEVFLLEQHFKELKDELITGNWLTAQNVVLNLALSGIFNQTMKDEIQLYIDTFVTNNY